MRTWIPWAILVAAVIHVVEEAALGWLYWAREFVPDVTMGQFVVVNAVFLGLCLAAALSRSVMLKLTIAGLVYCNFLVHAAPTVSQARVSPGLISATLLYGPLAALAFRSARRDGGVSGERMALATLLGALLMATPIVIQVLR
jgi:hypothetical protein